MRTDPQLFPRSGPRKKGNQGGLPLGLPEAASKIVFVCSDMWEPYLKRPAGKYW